MTPGRAPPRICLGVISGAHGIRGEVKIKSFASDGALLQSLGPLSNEDGTVNFEIVHCRETTSGWIAALASVRDRNGAEALRGTRLFVARSALPPTGADEFYQADLVGLPAFGPDGEPLGRIGAVHNYGAGDLLEIERPAGVALLIPFNAENIPEVDPARGVVVAAPATWIDLAEPAADEARHGR